MMPSMPIITWSDAYCTGDAVIDDQHRELFALVNELHDAIVVGRGRERIAPTLDRLAAYVTTHFAAEEELMERAGYAGLIVHRGRHRELASHAEKVIADYRAGRAVLTIALSRFLADWIRHHIDGEDKAMIAWFQRRERQT